MAKKAKYTWLLKDSGDLHPAQGTYVLVDVWALEMRCDALKEGEEGDRERSSAATSPGVAWLSDSREEDSERVRSLRTVFGNGAMVSSWCLTEGRRAL